MSEFFFDLPEVRGRLYNLQNGWCKGMLERNVGAEHLNG